ncbi:hypothetical protein [uncultured Lamprocystis sp.]|jgi:hypothetical protein|uniref:hypothetical protein n=1 Tax=uncultured Lamprocystis sp. TaxID=543132 RepID=UPI0025CF49FB|nr:hypothetical protein [uncultured Lamprocystis sp.]
MQFSGEKGSEKGGKLFGIGRCYFCDEKPDWGMTMTSVQIEIPDEIAGEFYRRAPHPERRVELVERIFREYFAAHNAAESELDILNQNAEELNREAEDVLGYQVLP